MFYDPRGQVIRTVNPDGSEQRVVLGVPVDLADPDVFAPTPWESYTYDANDNAGRTHPATADALPRPLEHPGQRRGRRARPHRHRGRPQRPPTPTPTGSSPARPTTSRAT